MKAKPRRSKLRGTTRNRLVKGYTHLWLRTTYSRLGTITMAYVFSLGPRGNRIRRIFGWKKYGSEQAALGAALLYRQEILTKHFHLEHAPTIEAAPIPGSTTSTQQSARA